MKKTLASIMISAAFALPLSASSAQSAEDAPGSRDIVLSTMGSLFFGGTVTRNADGTTFHGDHGYAQYYIPKTAKDLPIILWHGLGQSGRSFESTVDGREGFQAMLPRDGWATFIVDQPRRGRAGRTNVGSGAAPHPTTNSEAGVWSAFRMGRWVAPDAPTLNPGIQLPKTGYALDQFMRQQTPDTGERPKTPEFALQLARTMKALLEQTGPAVLLTHSASGQYGWRTVIESPGLVKAVVAFEPGSHVMPSDVDYKEVTSGNPEVLDHIGMEKVTPDEFAALTRIPLVLIYGDFIRTEPSAVFNEEVWRISLKHARDMVDEVNKRGGNATLMELTKLGIKGNTHAPFGDLNNKEVLNIVEQWLARHNLDKAAVGYKGPARPELPLSVPVKAN